MCQGCLRFRLALPANYIVQPEMLQSEETGFSQHDGIFGIAPGVEVVASAAQAYGTVAHTEAPPLDETYGVVPGMQLRKNSPGY